MTSILNDIPIIKAKAYRKMGNAREPFDPTGLPFASNRNSPELDLCAYWNHVSEENDPLIRISHEHHKMMHLSTVLQFFPNSITFITEHGEEIKAEELISFLNNQKRLVTL